MAKEETKECCQSNKWHHHKRGAMGGCTYFYLQTSEFVKAGKANDRVKERLIR